jgi:3-oxoacyl-[acyl-carrier protein] reductase
VNAIAPGWIETDMTSGVAPEEKKKALQLIPLGRMGKPADIAHTAVFLASDKASFITGQTIHVNGGEAMF